MQVLVNITNSPESFREQVIEDISRKRHPALEELVKTLSWMWSELKVSQTFCVPCFAGTGHTGRPKEVHGCCGLCPNLGETGCVAKPLGCALFFCGIGRLATPLEKEGYKGQQFARTITAKVQKLIGLPYTKDALSAYTLYASGYVNETKYNLTDVEVKTLKVATRMVKEEVKSFLALKRG